MKKNMQLNNLSETEHKLFLRLGFIGT